MRQVFSSQKSKYRLPKKSMTLHNREVPIGLLLEAGPSNPGRGVKARRGKTSQPGLIRKIGK